MSEIDPMKLNYATLLRERDALREALESVLSVAAYMCWDLGEAATKAHKLLTPAREEGKHE